ncbi:MAG TPA: alpha/beta hydrolase [Vineibacter sp.]|nr:alpha/beta hydrolase [Vineibacter sp.]
MPTTPTGLHYDVTDLHAPWETVRAPIVMHHGIGTDAAIWSGWLPVLAPHHRVLRFDLRGFGRSRGAWRDGTTLDELVGDLMLAAEFAGAPKVHLVGESLGGTVALAAALKHPERIASVTVSNATHRGTGIGRVRGWREEIERDGIGGWAEHMMPARFTDDAPISPAQRAWFARTQAASDPAVIVGLGELLAGLDMSDAMRRLSVPLLILSPDGSPFISAAMAAELKGLVPDAELMVFPGTRHGLPFSHARTCAETTLRFLQRRFG